MEKFLVRAKLHNTIKKRRYLVTVLFDNKDAHLEYSFYVFESDTTVSLLFESTYRIHP